MSEIEEFISFCTPCGHEGSFRLIHTHPGTQSEHNELNRLILSQCLEACKHVKYLARVIAMNFACGIRSEMYRQIPPKDLWAKYLEGINQATELMSETRLLEMFASDSWVFEEGALKVMYDISNSGTCVMNRFYKDTLR